MDDYIEGNEIMDERLVLVDERFSIAESLNSFPTLQSPSGYFETFRVDYSKSECPNEYIDEKKGLPIKAVYDHALILDILLRLKDYSTNKGKLAGTLSRGFNSMMGDAIICKTPQSGNNTNTIQWRYYNIDHQGQGKILPDIDDTGRCLISIERFREAFQWACPVSMSNKYSIINNPDNYRQFWQLMCPINDSFRPDMSIRNPS